MKATPRLLLLTAAAVAGTAGAATAQSLTIEGVAGAIRMPSLGAESVRPVGAVGAALAWVPDPSFGFEAGVRTGSAQQEHDGSLRWLRGEGGVRLGAPVARGVGLGLDLSGSLDRQHADAATTAAILTARPTLRLSLADWSVALGAEATRGRWTITSARDGSGPGWVLPGLPFRRQPLLPTPDARLEQTLDVETIGADLAVQYPVGLTSVILTARAVEATNGVRDGLHAGGELALLRPFGRVSASLVVGAWQVPDDAASTRRIHPVARLGLARELGKSVTLALQGTRLAPDPLYGTPAGTAAQLALSWRIGRPSRTDARVVDVRGRAPGGRVVRFRAPRPDAGGIAVAGDFSQWQPLPMSCSGRWCEREVVLAPGVHHFAFQTSDGRWTLPPGTPGVVDDGWDRPNGTVIIPEDY